jgi:hypothetical protein
VVPVSIHATDYSPKRPDRQLGPRSLRIQRVPRAIFLGIKRVVREGSR